MARDVEIDRRLLNWARWRAGRDGSLGYAQVDMGAVVVETSYRESRMPVIDSEARETDLLVDRLDAPLRQAVEVVYLQGGGVVTALTPEMCGVTSVQAVHDRIARAHRHLCQLVADLAAARRAERERIEQITRAA